MPIQNTIGSAYASGMVAAAYPGMIAETQFKDVYSKAVETAAVAFGLAVGAGTADGSVKLGGAGFEGITVADKSRDADQFDVGEIAGVMKKGTIWVTASTDVAPTDDVTFTAATGAIGKALATTITGAKFLATATSGNLVPVYLPGDLGSTATV
ncbi:hypothetical protein [Thioclava sp.]|uniref:structural cement protein Gp24 n=1 Tax=Thioclava sp. TaxID=1933450 RepID=UPI003242FF76